MKQMQKVAKTLHGLCMKTVIFYCTRGFPLTQMCHAPDHFKGIISQIQAYLIHGVETLSDYSAEWLYFLSFPSQLSGKFIMFSNSLILASFVHYLCTHIIFNQNLESLVMSARLTIPRLTYMVHSVCNQYAVNTFISILYTLLCCISTALLKIPVTTLQSIIVMKSL